MLDIKELRKLSKVRIKEAELLFSNRGYDTSAYLCGYAVEFALKYRICKCLKWSSFPGTNSEFGDLKFLKTHDYETLLRLTGKADLIKATSMPEWSVVMKWDPENRYNPLGTFTKTDARDMIASTKKIVEVLCGK
jgi:HEPN domain-containing protein